ncbi:MAG: hypothetical protein ACETVR_00765 [Candidatus Bathyarchaeia archaeon]
MPQDFEMFRKKRERLDFPTETLELEEYYIVSPEDVAQLDRVNVKFEGLIAEKPVVEFYTAGWPWSISSRLIEEDHGHRTTLKVGGVPVHFRGPLYLRKGEKVVVWGKIEEGGVQARRIEGEDAIYTL